ncbi:MAG TPA: hypothetical protein VFI65_23610 [Streptosporangiaceae bacterium]|nr:hypothetical protein [Streptosporangiaceae bacterium]
MLRSRLVLHVAALAGALSLAIGGAAVPASAGTGSIVIDGVFAPASEPGLLAIQIEATSPITSLTAHLYNSSQAKVLDLNSGDFTLTAGGSTDGVWTVTSAITQGQLGLGTYQVTVDATDQGGDSVTGASAGSFAFLIVPTVTLTSSPAVLSFARPSVTVSGTVTGRYPDGSDKPLADQPVTIFGSVRSWNTVTDSAGDYSLTLTPSLQDVLTASVPPSATVSSAASPRVGLNDQVSDVAVHVRLSTASANYGQPVTMSGTAQYQLDGIWKPLPNTAIDIIGVDFYSDSHHHVAAKTNASGQFSARLPSVPSATWTAEVASNQYLAGSGGSPGPYPSFAPNSAFLTVRIPTQIASPRVSFTPVGDISVRGCLEAAPPLRSDRTLPIPSSGPTAQLQFSRTAKGPWQNVGVMNHAGPAGCAATGLGGEFPSAVLSGYYRLSYPGDALFEPSVSAVRHAATARTKVTGFDVSPRSVAGHGRITVSGRLDQQAKGWRGLGRALIKVLIRPQGSSKWYWYKKLHTTASGRFRVSFADPVSGDWAALYVGDSTHLETVSKAIHVTATGTAAAGSAAAHVSFPADRQERVPARPAGGAGRIVGTPAAPAAGTITVTASSPTTSVGLLSLAFNSTTPVSGFTAHIVTSHGTDVLDLPESDFSRTSGSASVGTWTLTTPISEQQLALGGYQVTVDATNSGGTSISGSPAGTLDFVTVPTITLKATPATIGYAHPTVTLSGTVTGLRPDGSQGPLAGETVFVLGSSYSGITDASGNYSIAVAYMGTYSVYVQGTDTGYATSPSVTVSGHATQTALTAKLSTTKTSFGRTVTVSGTLTYKPGSTWVPLAGAQVVIADAGYPQNAPITNSAGHYSATFTAIGAGVVTVYFHSEIPGLFTSSQWLDGAQAQTKSLTVTLPTAITRFSATVDSRGVVSVHGCLGIDAIWSGSAYYGQHPVTIQYAPRPSGPWQRLGTITVARNDISCGIAELEASFTGTFPARLARAYYRAHFPGEPQQGEPWQSSTGPAQLAWKYQTKFSPFTVSPRHVAKGGRITISGRLLQDTSGWRGFGHQQVLIIYRKPGQKTWYWIAKTRTSAAGRFSARVKAPFNAYWSVYYAGNASHFVSSPAGVYVSVG